MAKKLTKKQLSAIHAKKNKGGAKLGPYPGGEHDTLKSPTDCTTFTNSTNSQNNSASMELSNTKKQSQNNKKNHGRKTNTELTPDQKKIEQKKIEQTAIRQKEIMTMIQWSGCMAIPQHCMIIKGVNVAYDLYKTENMSHFRNIVKVATRNIINQKLENPIDIYSDSIFKIINNHGFIDNIHKDIKLDEAVFQDMIKGTIQILINNTIDNVM